MSTLGGRWICSAGVHCTRFACLQPAPDDGSAVTAAHGPTAATACWTPARSATTATATRPTAARTLHGLRQRRRSRPTSSATTATSSTATAALQLHGDGAAATASAPAASSATTATRSSGDGCSPTLPNRATRYRCGDGVDRHGVRRGVRRRQHEQRRRLPQRLPAQRLRRRLPQPGHEQCDDGNTNVATTAAAPH